MKNPPLHLSLSLCYESPVKVESHEKAQVPSQEFLSVIHEDLQLVELSLDNEIRSAFGVASEVIHMILGARAKRIRPATLLLVSRIFGYQGERAVNLSAALEMIHSATLLHDDVVDESEERRGKRSAWNMFGSKLSILTGDYLFARALVRLSSDPNPLVWKEVSYLVERLCQGELIQLSNVRNVDMTREIYFDIVERKTAHFFETCCALGGILGGLTVNQLDSLRRFGFQLGMAFQITDDLLDYTGDPHVLGKPIGRDLSEGKVTLPLIEALQDATSEQKKKVSEYLETGPDENIYQEILANVKTSAGISRTREIALEYKNRALQELGNVQGDLDLRYLVDLTGFIVDRSM